MTIFACGQSSTKTVQQEDMPKDHNCIVVPLIIVCGIIGLVAAAFAWTFVVVPLFKKAVTVVRVAFHWQK